jgi:periplasmic divalent cation tolerance protein
MQAAADCVIVETTVGSATDAERIAAVLVERRLATCVQLAPVTSTYRWQGEVQRDAEVLLRIKTVSARLPAIEAAIGELHPYALPELVAVPLTAGGADYLAWLRAESSDEPLV